MILFSEIFIFYAHTRVAVIHKIEYWRKLDRVPVSFNVYLNFNQYNAKWVLYFIEAATTLHIIDESINILCKLNKLYSIKFSIFQELILKIQFQLNQQRCYQFDSDISLCLNLMNGFSRSALNIYFNGV